MTPIEYGSHWPFVHRDEVRVCPHTLSPVFWAFVFPSRENVDGLDGSGECVCFCKVPMPGWGGAEVWKGELTMTSVSTTLVCLRCFPFSRDIGKCLKFSLKVMQGGR